MSIDILKEELKHGSMRNLYLFYGPEEYLKRYYLQKVEDSILKGDNKAFNRVLLDGKVDIKKVIDNCETMPMFSEKKVVIVKNSSILKPKKKDNDKEEKVKTQDNGLISCLENLPDYTCLIFCEEEIDKRLKIIDVFKKKGLIVECTFQKPTELARWAMRVFKSLRKEIDMATASYLIDNCEQGMNQVFNEINKVASYIGSRVNVDTGDIDAVCSKSIKSRIFDLTDAIAQKDGGKALKMLDDMIALKEPLQKILFMITRQFRHILEVKMMHADGIPVNEAALKLKIPPYAAGKIFKQVNGFTVDRLKKAIYESFELDAAIKSGRIDNRVAAEILIAQFSK